MRTNDKSGPGISRRHLLGHATVTACGAAIALAAATESVRAAQVSQQAAGYQPTPKGDQKCENCALFVAPAACKFVSGDISPSGWCKLYVKRN